MAKHITEQLKEHDIRIKEAIRINDEEEAKLKRYKENPIKETDFKPVIETYFNISKFNKATPVFLGKKARIYDHTKLLKKNEGVSYKSVYSLYEGSIGSGNNSIFILTENKLDTGDNILFLKALTDEETGNMLFEIEYNFLYHTLCKKLFVKTTKGKGDNIEKRGRGEVIKDISKLEYRFFKPILPISKEELSKTDNFLELCIKLLTNGMDKYSNKLIYLTASHIPEVDPSLIAPGSYMKYGDHEICITKGGEGKTTLTEHITGEANITEATIPNLLGSSDGKNKWYGKLHERTKILGIDENQDRIDEDVLGHLNNYMELGRYNRGKGEGINGHGYTAIRFLGNVKPREEEEEEEEGQQDLTSFQNYISLKRWRDFLIKLSRNIYPFHRRISTLLFDLGMKKIRGKGISQEEQEKSIAIIKTIAEGYKKQFTALFLNGRILEWLNKDFDKEYLEHIDKLTKECKDSLVKESILARKESHRHTRGQALRLAWLEVGLSHYIKNKNNNNLERAESQNNSIKVILESAENHLAKLKDINLDSIQNILSITEGEIHQQIGLYKLQGLKPKYLKLAIYTFLEYLGQQEEINKNQRVITLNLIEECFEDVKDLFIISKKDTYRSFYEIRRKIEDNENSIRVILEDYGLEYDSKNKALIILNNQPYQLLKYYTELSNIKLQKLQRLQKDKGIINNIKLQRLQRLQKRKESVVFVVCSFDKKQDNIPKTYEQEEIIDLLNLIKEHDKGEGVLTQDIIDLTKWNEPDVIKELTRLSKQGDIYEHKPDSWKVLL